MIHQNWMWSTGLLFQNGIVNIPMELYIFVGVSWCCECHNEIIYMNGGNHNYLPEGWFTLYLRNTYFKSSLSSRSCCIKGKFEYCLVWFSFPKVQVDLKIQIKNCNKQKANWFSKVMGFVITNKNHNLDVRWYAKWYNYHVVHYFLHK